MTEEEQKHATKAELEALAEAVRKELLSLEKEMVSREEFGVLQDTLDGVRRQLPESSSPNPYTCTEKGCSFQTYDIEKFVDHRIERKLGGLSQPKGHQTVEELVACKECFSKLVSAIEHELTGRGFRKAEGVCPDCGTELVKPFLEKPYCPKCSPKKRSLF